jgi:hypothetical protein
MNTKPLQLWLRREPYQPFVGVYFHEPVDDSEPELEMEVEEARTWFRRHGANMDAVESTLDYLWNFYNAAIVIKNPTFMQELSQYLIE